MRINISTLVCSILAVLAVPLAALAGGPLYINPTTGQPYKYGPGPVQVYTDLGTLGILSNDAADANVAYSWKQWTDVPSSSFEAQVAGDFSTIGLPDITSANATQVIGPNNGGGIHVIYDHDGKILRNVLGAPPSVAGIATPEWANEATGEIVESWVILNGSILTTAARAENFKGVMTHEFGHSINLAHSQTNGAIVYYGDAKGPAGCTSLPYAGAPVINDIETMFPLIDINSSRGLAQSTVDITDDVVSLSNLYPAPGWPESAGTIAGTITQGDGTSQVTGVNVIARNVANPWKDAVSALSGDQTQGWSGPDGRYTFNGLTPGAQYVVYVDGIVQGGFSTPPALVLPGFEEFFSGAIESANGLTDLACEATPVTATVGATATADIALNEGEGAPKLTVIGMEVSPTSITADGSTIVGVFLAPGAPAFRWTEAGGLENIGGIGGTSPGISADGSAIVASVRNPADNNRITAALWQGGTSWTPLPGLSNFFGATRSGGYGVSDGGAAAVGLAYDTTPTGGSIARAFKWDAATNTSSVLETPASSIQSRANGISQDGSVVWGWHAINGPREAVVWLDGVFTPLKATRYAADGTPFTHPLGEAYRGNVDGTIVVGASFNHDVNGNPFWRWTALEGVTEVAMMPGYRTTHAYGVNATGNVIVGFGMGKETPFGYDSTIREGFIWTPGLGLMPLNAFLTSQGTRIPDAYLLAIPNSISASGNRITGSGYILPYGTPYAWVVDIQKVKICHAPPGNPNNAHTIEVAFPDGIDDHLEHGDTLGPCACEDEGNGNGNGNGGH